MSMKKDSASIVFSILSLVSLLLPGFAYFKKMRIMTSASLSAGTCLGVFYPLFIAVSCLLIIIQFIKKGSWKNVVEGILPGISISLIMFVISNALEWLPLEKTEFSRLSIGPAMWLWLACMSSIIVRGYEKTVSRLRIFYYFIPLTIILSLLFTGNLNGLGVMREYATYGEQFWENVIRHLSVSFWVMVVALAIGIPLGYLTNKNERIERAVFSVINVTETIPGISFIGLMIIPLAALASAFPALKAIGIRGYGIPPIFLVLLIYALYPIIINTRAAFRTIDQFYFEVAEALGMTPRQIFFRIQIPIVLPTILSGVRIALLHTIGGMSLAAVIGGGGLGLYMFQTESMDVVLLGAIPVIMMTFIADKSLKRLVQLLPGGKSIK